MQEATSASTTVVAAMPSTQSTLLVELVAGGIAGIVSDAAMHPVDTVRTLLMTEKRMRPSTLQVLRNTKNLYRGFGVVAALTFPAHALYFIGYEETKRQLGDSDTVAAHLTAGLMADVAGSLIWVPNDVVKQRCQVSPGTSSTAAFKAILQSEGPLGLYRGYLASMAVYGPFVSIYFAAYEWSKSMLPNRDSFAGQIACGAVGATVASAITNPVDVIKTRLQVDTSYTGIRDCVSRTLREEGVGAFKRGLGARILWLSPSCAISIAVFEQSKRLLSTLQ